jgi:gliding motility-associated-like protein
MKKLLFLLFFPLLVICQNEFNQWHFGNNIKLDFNSGLPLVSYQSALTATEGAASVADCGGDLLFYTDGQTVYNKTHSIMVNGTRLNGRSFSYPSTQGALIVKRPKSASIYYIFTASDIYGISYSIVNMQLNNGLGAIIQKNTNLSSKPSQKLAVTYHSNEEDIWVGTHYENSNQYEMFKVLKTGVSSSSVVSLVGAKHTGGHGDMKFNQQGTKIGAVVQDQKLVSVADFNNSTGKVVNSYGIINKYGKPHGVDFSPNGSYMYISSWDANGGVYQLAMAQGNIEALKNGISLSGNFVQYGSLQLAPDGKIYITNDQASYISVIGSPNNFGFGAGFNRYGVLVNSYKLSWELSNVTLTNRDIPDQNGITASDFCFSFPTDFGIVSEKGVISVLWNFDDPGSGIFNNSVAYYPDHIFSNVGVFNVSLTVSTVCGVEYFTFPLTIEKGPEHSFDDQNYCMNTDYKFPGIPISGESYSWTPLNGLSDASLLNPVFNSKGLTDTVIKYGLISTSSKGCTNEDSVLITLLDLPKAGDNQFQCPGFGVSLTLDGSAESVVWSPDNNINNVNYLSPEIQAQSSIYYVAEIIDTNGCINRDSVWIEVGDDFPADAGQGFAICFGDTVTIGGEDSLSNATYFWGIGTNIENVHAPFTKVSPYGNEYYYLTVSIDTCSQSDSVLIQVNSLPDVRILPQDTSVCFLDSITFKAVNSVSYNWFIANGLVSDNSNVKMIADTSFKIVVEGVDTNNCANTDTANFTVLQLPIPKLTSNNSLCIGDSIQLEVAGGEKYIWLNQEVSGSIDSILTVTPQETKNYRVVLIGRNSCRIEDSVVITVNTLPVLSMTSDTLICEGTNAKLWAKGAFKYIWSPTTFLPSSTFNSAQITPTSLMIYQVIGEDINGCIDSLNTSISLNVVPESNYSYTYFPSCLGFEVEFKDSSVNADSYQWIFGDGTYSTELSPSNIFDFNNRVNTSLIVGNNKVCFDTLITLFNWKKIGDFIDVFTPNIITPNGDGINDCFAVKVPAEFEGCVEYEVYNRWGLKVYDTKEFSLGFCGSNAYNNKPLAEGTYFYSMSIKDYQINGFVTIRK